MIMSCQGRLGRLADMFLERVKDGDSAGRFSRAETVVRLSVALQRACAIARLAALHAVRCVASRWEAATRNQPAGVRLSLGQFGAEEEDHDRLVRHDMVEGLLVAQKACACGKVIELVGPTLEERLLSD